MTNITRSIDVFLNLWRVSTSHKPLLVRGARQIGKTFSIRRLGQSFKNLLEINFLENKKAGRIFAEGDLDPNRICRELSAIAEQPIDDGDTLLFLDEIQACPHAIEALRFFFEKRPNLHVIAAGSLLEFALQELTSFGVGRVESVYMHPLTFEEFLKADGGEELFKQISLAGPKRPLPTVLHERALSKLRNYLIIGGLPEIAANYIEQGDFTGAGQRISSICDGYEDDFAKYRGKIPAIRLSDTLRAVAQQTGKKFVHRHAYIDAVSSQVHHALKLLELAGLVVRVQHSAANGIPLGAEVDSTRFKTMLFDIGIYQKLLGISARDLIGDDIRTLVHRGSLSEAFVGTELLSSTDQNSRGDLYYWHRESKSSNAELDYLIQHKTEIYPIEVKANTKGSMTSMRMFMAEKSSPLGVRISAENFGMLDNILILPLYAVSQLHRLLDEFGKRR